ncbi:SH3-containing GRB2-like protein 3-interacting protein 1 isoform X1 [Trematomus bernacchii]|uniref:SH3-containing GRB2-like protein 3-interacting protein 1 isoform X1 n=1 Tax=Trematomus bernacchii TaxID=40690 RepID=UPI00146E55E3|nr:SH3-containing GRB2-like protein 3-interacting protein 1 isoform X1 [Trematomus bernacchii]XP_034002780.1 SH3-containing GRB2-like protein 3-interacting protein 1 isoform X1 [Trematomus bernacchii]
MMEGLKKRTRKAFGIRKKEKDNDSTGSPDRDSGSQKKANGAPNGFYEDIDWERYNSPEVDDEGYSLRPEEESEEGVPTTKKTHFFSSDESEGEEDHRKKFKIKIKPLPSNHVVAVPSVDELKASIGNIALSPSPMKSPRRSPGLKRNTSIPGEEIARPRRIIPTLPTVAPTLPTVAPTLPTVAPTPAPAPQPPSSQQTPFSEDTTALFGPPLDTAFGESKTEVGVFESDAWGIPLSEPESSLTRSFPTGTPPPLPPKIVPTPTPSTGPPSADDAEVSIEADAPTRKPSIADLDNIFGPEQPSSAGEETSDSWVSFSLESSEQRPLPEEPAPPQPASPPPPESPAPPLPASPLPPEDPAPPLPASPPPKDEPVPPLPISPPPTEEPAALPVRSGPPTPEDRIPPTLATSPPPAPPKDIASPPASSPPPLDSPPSVPPAPAPRASTPPAVTPPTEQPAACSVPPSLVLSQEEQAENTEVTQPKDDGGETVPSPTEANQGSRSTPPPPPPPTYRAVVSSPGPTSGAGGTNSGSSSPVRPSTPSSVNPTPPPPPPRPSSRPKLPPGKPTIGDASRPFSPPVHSASPPPVAPLARAESTSSISSTNSMSAATTPTVSKELSVSVSENDQPSLVWFDRGKFYLTFEGCSRGPSPLTMGAQDTLPVAAAFTETVNAFFKGADPSKCVVKIIGEMVLSFPAGITRHFANNPSPAVLTFSITNYSRLEHVLPNPQLLCCDTTTQAKADAKDFWVNMPNLISHLKKVAEQKPQATYYNVDMLKYQVSTEGLQSIPLNLAVSWRCEPASTDLRIDYKYNKENMTTPMALNNVQFLVPVDGGVSKLQAVLPPAAWNAEQKRIHWKIPEISQKSENGGVGSLLARFQLTEGPSKPAPLAVQFTSEGSILSGCDIELAGPGYRFSLIKKRFAAGKYLADN